MRNIPSSRAEVFAQLSKWDEAKSPIKALFSGDGFNFCIPCSVRFLSGDGRVILQDGTGEMLGSFLVIGDSFPKSEPLLDASEDVRWKLEFFLGIEFTVSCGTVGLY